MNSLRLIYRSFTLIMTVIICLMLIGSQILISLSYAQGSNIMKKAPTNMLAKSKLEGIKIIFPAQGQGVPDGKNLTLTGMSTYNSHTKCQVSIIVNNIKPYQRVIATGHNGTNDYSTWKFPLSAKYTTLKAGLSNKATAKLTCNDKPTNLTKYYSVNFTSVSNFPSTSHVQLPVLKNDSNVSSSNKNQTKLLSLNGKQESNKPMNASIASTIDEHNKMTKDQQKTHYTTTVPRTGTQDNKLLIKPESTATPKDSMLSGTKSPFVLTLPSFGNNSSVSSNSSELQSDSHLKNNNANFHHHKD